MATGPVGAITSAGDITAILAARRSQEQVLGGTGTTGNVLGFARAGGLLQPYTATGIGSPLTSTATPQPLGTEAQQSPSTLGFLQTRGDTLVSTLLAPSTEAANDAANDAVNGLLAPADNGTDPAQLTLPFNEGLAAQDTQDALGLAPADDNTLNPLQSAEQEEGTPTANPLAAQEPNPFAYYDPLDTNQDGVVSEAERYAGAQEDAATTSTQPEAPSFLGTQASALYVNTATERAPDSLLDAVV